MSFKPDYGLTLIKEGVSREVIHHFNNFPLYSLTILGPSQYSTTVDMPYADEIYAVSLDFDQRQLEKILLKASPEIVSLICKEIKDDPSTPRTIDFEGAVVFGVHARLGEIQHVQYESFVPLVAQEIY